MPVQRRKVAIGFMVVWLAFWTAGILIVLWGFGGLVLRGELGPALVLALWLAAAGFGLYVGARKLKRLLLGTSAPGPSRDHVWSDGVPRREQP